MSLPKFFTPCRVAEVHINPRVRRLLQMEAAVGWLQRNSRKKLLRSEQHAGRRRRKMWRKAWSEGVVRKASSKDVVGRRGPKVCSESQEARVEHPGQSGEGTRAALVGLTAQELESCSVRRRSGFPRQRGRQCFPDALWVLDGFQN